MPPSTRPSNPERAVGGRWRAGFDRLVRMVALWGGGLTLLALILLIVCDVVLRYVCNAPIFGARDLGKLLLTSMIALATAYSARSGGQVAIEAFSRFLGRRGLRRVEIAVRLGAALMLAVLSWRLLLGGMSSGRYGEASLSLGIPHAPFYWLLAAGMALYGLALVVEIALLLSGADIDPQLIDRMEP